MKTKNVLPVLILGQSFLINGQAMAQEQQQAATENKQAEAPKEKVEKQSKLKALLESAHLDIKTGVKLIDSKDVKLSVGVGYESEATIGGSYLGVDTFLVAGGYLPDNGLGVSIGREVTFIEKFNTRNESIHRELKGFTPKAIKERIPLTAEQALAMHEFQFVGFRAPLTISLGAASLGDQLNKMFEQNSFSRLFVTGETDIHIYRMPENRVRVRIFSLKEKGLEAGIGIKAIGVNTILRKLLKINPLEIFASKKNSDLFSVDYVFNLNDEEARNQYTNLVGQKFRVSKLKDIGAQVLSNLKIGSSKDISEAFYADLDEVQKVVDRDMTKSYEERGIIRLRQAHSDTDSTEVGIRSFIAKIISFVSSRKDANTFVSVTNVVNNMKQYILKTTTKQFKFELFTLFGKENKSESGLLLSAKTALNPETNKWGQQPTDVLGFQMRRFKKQLELSADDVKGMKETLQRNLPSEIFEKIQWPEWKLHHGTAKNVTLEQILFFNVPALQEIKLTQADISNKLLEIIRSRKEFGSEPKDYRERNVYGEEDERYQQYNRKQYEKAFSIEIRDIPNSLTTVLNKNETLENRLMHFDYLQQFDLFHEIGPILVMQLIPKNQLANIVSYKLSLSAKDKEGTTGEQTTYPEDNDKLEYMNIVSSAVAETNENSNRSFNVRLFINEKGESISLQELIKLNQ